MPSAPSGSGNKVKVYTTSGTGLDTSVFTFDKNTNEAPTGDITTEDLQLALTSLIDNASFLTFKQTYVVNGDIQTEILTYTDASQETNVTIPSGSTRVMVGWQGGVISGQRKLTFFEGLVGVQQGAKTANTTNEYTVTFTAIPAATDFVLSATTVNADFDITGASDVTIAQNTFGTELFATSA